MYKMNEISTCRIMLNDNNEFTYRYYITESEKVFSFNNGVKVPCYGIYAESEKMLGEKVVATYEDAIECISSNKEKVLDIIKFLEKNEVSPIHLVDIVGEKVDNMISDFDINTSDKSSYTYMKEVI